MIEQLDTIGISTARMTPAESKLARTDAAVKAIDKAEKTAVDAKTARLRALRLAKEEQDRAAGASAPVPAVRRKKTKA